MVGFWDVRGVVYMLYRTKNFIDVTVMMFWERFMCVIISWFLGSDILWKNFVLVCVLAIYFWHNSGRVMCVLLGRSCLGM